MPKEGIRKKSGVQIVKVPEVRVNRGVPTTDTAGKIRSLPQFLRKGQLVRKTKRAGRCITNSCSVLILIYHLGCFCVSCVKLLHMGCKLALVTRGFEEPSPTPYL